jgi:uncharacterized protein (DUF1778 family)
MFFRSKIVSSPAEQFCSSMVSVATLTLPQLPAPATKKTRRSRHAEKRSAQMNFRASPSIKELAQRIADKADMSIGDVMENAIVAYAKSQGVK